MSVVVEGYRLRAAGETHCARCGDITEEPFEMRGPCGCGSNAWTTGLPMVWPPTLGHGAPAFLLGMSIPPLLPSEPRPSGHTVKGRGSANNASKLTENDVRAIRQAVAEGTPFKKLMQRYHVGKSTVSDIVRRVRWSHVE